MCLPLLLLFMSTLLIQEGFACIGSQGRQFVAPSSGYQYGGQPFQAPAAAVRVAGSQNVESSLPIVSYRAGGENTAVNQQLFGPRVALSEFSSNSYNAEGGGPVAQGSALQCDFGGRPCCWANVPTPDDQIDWQLASGVPQSQLFYNVTIDGNYLVAYAGSAAPSDEAQFASCSVGCASSPIRVRTRHWQSSNVLLQVCQRESFPNSVNYNPLLNCQEFPIVQGIGFTELILPKASLVDIVFVASNFVNEGGDIALLDNIEIVYDSDPNECESPATAANGEANVNKVGFSEFDSHHGSAGNIDNLEATNSFGQQAGANNGLVGSNGAIGAGSLGGESKWGTALDGQTGLGGGANFNSDLSGISSLSHLNNEVAPRAFGVSGATGNTRIETMQENSFLSSNSKFLPSSSSSSIKEINSIRSCQNVKCTFEDGTTCSYKDTYKNETISGRGLMTHFQIVKGQFMNRVTGVREGIEGNYYAATFLYPRERAELVAKVMNLPEDRRLRFQYYEGTHGVQLKGCCDTVDVCPFSSDKFVSVSDRVWKYGQFACPRDTQKIIFSCENTRTNQGACALDDIQVFENVDAITAGDKPLC